MASSRQLAAIFFSDIVGYTSLMGDDEERAFELLRKNRQLQKPLIERFGGLWIKEIGDGVLASFPSISDSVTCACQIQQEASSIPDLRLRIGIHLGEVMFEDGDVFGDGVNIASRLQTMAPIGGIWVSESVYLNVANKKGIDLYFVREEQLKNVKQPIRVYEVVLAGQSARTPPGNPVAPQHPGPAPYPKTIPEKSVAVLPFVNMSNDPDQDYFSDGLSEEIINSLSHLQDLKVAGRSSSFQFKGPHTDLKEVREKLGVRTVLEGSVRRYGNLLRLTVQLVNVEDGFHIWSERYEKTLDNIFAIQDEIATAVTEKLKVSLLDDERQLLSRVNTQDPKAYERYLQGRFYLNRRGISIVKALELFEQAVALDPAFALAHAGIADACFLLGVYSIKAPNIVMPKGKLAADTAVRLDSSLFEPYASLGFYYAVYAWDWQKSKENFLKSLENNPTYIHGRCWYALYYLSWLEGNFSEAESICREAIQLDPLSGFPYGILAAVYYGKGDYEQAIRTAEYANELDLGAFLPYLVKGNSLIRLNRSAEAVECFELSARYSGRFPLFVAMLVFAYSRAGNPDMAGQCLGELNSCVDKGIHVSPYLMGMAYSCLGELDESFRWLNRAFEEHDPDLVTSKNYYFGPEHFREDPRFRQIVSNIRFPE